MKEGRAFRGKKASYPDVEKVLVDFVREKRKNALHVNYDLIRRKALEVARQQKLPRSFRARNM